MTKIKSKYGIHVELDEKEIYLNDPGQGTPVLVVLENGDSATWNCAISEGEVEGNCLDENQIEWLAKVTPQVEEWMKKNGV